MPEETIVPPQEPNSTPTPTPVSTDFLSAIGYLPCLFVLPILLSKNPDAPFHSEQGALLTGLWMVVLVVAILSPMIGVLLAFALAGVTFVALFKAFNGGKWRIPVLGGIAEKLDFVGFLKMFGLKK